MVTPEGGHSEAGATTAVEFVTEGGDVGVGISVAPTNREVSGGRMRSILILHLISTAYIYDQTDDSSSSSSTYRWKIIAF